MEPNGNEYRRVPRSFLDDYVRCNIGVDNHKYKIGDIIHYPGKAYNHRDFYAYINHITKTSMGLTLLIKYNNNNEVIFYEPNKNPLEKNLTRRPFNLFNQ